MLATTLSVSDVVDELAPLTPFILFIDVDELFDIEYGPLEW